MPLAGFDIYKNGLVASAGQKLFLRPILAWFYFYCHIGKTEGYYFCKNKFVTNYVERFIFYISQFRKKDMASTDVADLLFRFQQIQADDHDILMNRFCELIQESFSVDLNYKSQWIFENQFKGANQDSAQFYLESFNWNLQAAVNAWFEYGGVVSLPRAKFIDDVTIGEGQSVPPSNEFTKTWAIRELIRNLFVYILVYIFIQNNLFTVYILCSSIREIFRSSKLPYLFWQK